MRRALAGEEFDDLDVLFADVDAHVEDAALREQTGGISGEVLRKLAGAAYSRLFGDVP